MSISPSETRAGRLRIRLRPASASPIGLSLAGDLLRFSRARTRGGQVRWQTGELRLPAEALEPGAAGRRRLREIARAAAIPRGPAHLVLASPAIDVFPLMLAPAEGAARDLQVVNRAREQLPYPLAEAVLDYEPLPDAVRRKGEEGQAVLAYCAPRALAELWVERLGRIGLEVQRLMTPAGALAPWLAGPIAETRRLLVTTGEEATSIAVVQLGTVLLERILPWGSRAWIARLQAELDLSEPRCRALLEQPEPPPAVGEILGPLCEEMAREADGCLAYCDSYLVAAPPASLVLLGTLADHRPLSRFLEKALQIPVRGAAESLPIPGLELLASPALFVPGASGALVPAKEAA